MTQIPLQTYFVLDGELILTSDFEPGKYNGGVYEVLRVINGVALFMEEHLNRFFNSIKIENQEINFSKEQIENHLNKLIVSNKVDIGNIMISFQRNLAAWFIPYSYPATELYTKGIECGLLYAERENPNAKVMNTHARIAAIKILSENPFYEVLLVDSQSRITEGSKSNVFFILENILYTAPSDNVLPGITRQKVLQLATDLEIQCIEKEIHTKDIANFKAAFLTGTSPKILPINKIGDISFDPVNPVLSRLIGSYDQMIGNYIRNKLNIIS